MAQPDISDKIGGMQTKLRKKALRVGADVHFSGIATGIVNDQRFVGG